MKINELSQKLLKQYKKTAEADKEMQKSAFFGNKKTADKREKGIKMADKKIASEAFATNPLVRGLYFETQKPVQIVEHTCDPYCDHHVDQEAHHRKEEMRHMEMVQHLSTTGDKGSSVHHHYHKKMAAHHKAIGDALAKLNALNKEHIKAH